MHQSDTSSSYYDYYQSHFQSNNPAPIPISADPSQFNSSPATFASAPPVSSSDYSNYPQTNPYYHYDQKYTGLSYDHVNPNYGGNSNLSALPNYESSIGSSAYGDQGLRYDRGEFRDDVIEEGVYRYNGGNGGKVEPYGARGSHTVRSGTGLVFDDYGRPINHSDSKDQNGSGSFGNVLKAAPKIETKQDAYSGVQKFRVKLLSEGGGQNDMDVLCQVGLNGIQIIDPGTSQRLKIYPFDTVTRWDVLDSHIFAFWAISSIDIEPRRIRLKSNSYSTNNILDTVTAAAIQYKEMSENSKTSDYTDTSEQPFDKKKAFDWMNLIKPGNEEKDHWVPDEAVTKCTACRSDFGAFLRRHHCRNCGEIFCDKCTQGRVALTADGDSQPVRVCDQCMAEVTHRLFNAKEASKRDSGLQRHEDLARKLQEEMEKNRKPTTGINSSVSDKRMREVECPTCTVHLQLEVPEYGSKTIECSVCQHPFLVAAH
jgi:hypothetical protein